jgi:outer membrane protein W
MNKNILKTTILAAFTMLIGKSSAQLTYFARGGMNLSSLVSIDADGVSEKNLTSRVGFQVGGGIDFALNDKMGIELSVLYAQRGATLNVSETDVAQGTETSITSKVNLNYIDIPLNFRFSTEVGPGKLNILVGPKFGIGLSGNWNGDLKATFAGQTFSNTIDEKMTFGNNDTCDFKTLDMGIGFGLGYEIEKFHIQATYTYGLTNHVNNPVKSEKDTQNMIAISVGYRFND